MSLDIETPAVSASPFATSSKAIATSSSTLNPFSNPFGSSVGSQPTSQLTTNVANNPFAPKPQSFSSPQNVFGGQASMTSSTPQGVFGGSSATQSNPFSNPLGSSPSPSTSFAKSGTTSPFGTASAAHNNFGKPLFGAAIPPLGTSSAVFGTPSQNLTNGISNGLSSKSVFGSSLSSSSSQFSQKPQPQILPTPTTAQSSFSQPKQAFTPTKSKLAIDIENLLKKRGIIPPAWPTLSPGDPKYKATIEAFWQSFKAYRAKVRTCLIQNGLLDDPEKPKKLSEAIDFKGTCEEMCPEFEKITRIMEHDVREPEKVPAPDGNSLWPSPPKMIKALARSAAGQDAPLPEDVRSPAALRRTLDYLIDEVLASKELRQVHGYLWDRTRAIRRDFVFQQASMSPEELSDEVYCLEIITRFHVTALHQMSRQGNATEDFSEQQEVEQLGKALLSLIHAYEDCKVQSIPCENEAEFRAYYVIFNSHNPGILEAVQDWGWKFWGESKLIQVAVSLVETLQNVWDSTGPLKPHSSTNIAQNYYGRFFAIVNGGDVSYTMACFAEIHFNKVRKAILKTMIMGYRKQRDQAKDWNLTKMNEYLHFDREDDIVSFGEAYGLNFEDFNGEDVLVIDSDDAMDDPFPPLKQEYSENIVERKRGNHSLAEVIHHTVYGDVPEEGFNDDTIRRILPKELVPLSASSSPFNGALTKPTVTPNSLSTLGGILQQTPSAIGSEMVPVAQTTDGEAVQQPFFATSSQNPFQGFSKPALAPYQPDNAVKAVSSAQESKTTAALFTPSPFFTPFPPVSTGSLISSSSIFPPPAQIQAHPLGNIKALDNLSTSPFSFLGNQSTVQTSGLSAPVTKLPSLFPLKEQSDIAAATPSLNVTNKEKPEMKGFSPPTTSFFPSLQQKPETSIQQTSSVQGNSQFRSMSAQLEPPILPNFFNKNEPAVKPIPTETPNKPAEKPMKLFADWYALAEGGSVDDFAHFTIESILNDAMKQFRAEKRAERKLEKEKLVEEEAVKFRQHSLALKYVYRWREIVHHNFVKRKGREGREARLRFAAELHASKVAGSSKAMEDFRASRSTSKIDKINQQLVATGALGDVYNLDEKMKSVLQGNGKRTRDSTSQPHQLDYKSSRSSNSALGEAKKRQKSMTSTPEASDRVNTKFNSSTRTIVSPARVNGSVKSLDSHRRAKSESKPKVSPMCDPHISRIYAFDSWSLEDEMRERNRKTNHVKTDYFRLKARGITTLPDGTPLARSAAVHLAVSSAVPQEEVEVASPRRIVKTSEERDMDMEEWKAKAKKIMAEDEERRRAQQAKKRQFEDDDDELFAKAKRIREQMDEDSEWLKTEVEKSTVSRSHS
jgi:hypothetical protein